MNRDYPLAETPNPRKNVKPTADSSDYYGTKEYMKKL